MKDTEMRGMVLQAFYEKRRAEKPDLGFNDFDLPIGKDDFLRVAEQLAEHGLLDWHPLRGSQNQRVDGRGSITSFGVDVIESDGEESPIRMEFPDTNAALIIEPRTRPDQHMIAQLQIGGQPYACAAVDPHAAAQPGPEQPQDQGTPAMQQRRRKACQHQPGQFPDHPVHAVGQREAGTAFKRARHLGVERGHRLPCAG